MVLYVVRTLSVVAGFRKFKCARELNPVTVPACKNPGLKDAERHTRKQYIFRSYDTSTFSTMRSDENPFTCQCGNEDKKA